jgi:hypothetical protein
MRMKTRRVANAPRDGFLHARCKENLNRSGLASAGAAPANVFAPVAVRQPLFSQ